MIKIFLITVFSCLFALSALAQNSSSVTQVGPGSTASGSPAKGIGPAPANSKQHQIPKLSQIPAIATCILGAGRFIKM
jgi:hypothetical protein